MGRLEPLTSLALGRSPYDDVVPGEGVADPRAPQLMYDERGRPYNPQTKRINRDVIRSHNEVMMVIGVAEPDNGIAEAQAEAARKHYEFEERVGRRLLLAGGMLETAAIWGVNGLRQRILLYQEYSNATFYGMFRLVRSQQSISSYFFGGLPSFIASSVLEQLAVPAARKYPIIQYVTTYIRLHLAIYTFFQRTGIIPVRNLLPNWRFFIPGTNISPIPLPPFPRPFRPQSLLQWLGLFAIGAAPFAGFYLYTKLYSIITRTLRCEIYRRLPRPYNSSKRRSRRDTASAHQPAGDIPIELRTDEVFQTHDTHRPSSASARRHSAASQRGTNPSDEFASDDEDTEIISATLISFDVEATEPMPDHHQNQSSSEEISTTGPPANTPGVWSAELRPNVPSDGMTRTGAGGNGVNGGQEPLYRETMLTRLPAVLATDVLAITPARLIMTPLAAVIWLRLARPYMIRMGMSVDGLLDVGKAVAEGRRSLFAGLFTARGLINLLGLELLLAVVHGEAWAAVMTVAEMLRMSEEEWYERMGVPRESTDI